MEINKGYPNEKQAKTIYSRIAIARGEMYEKTWKLTLPYVK